MLHTITHKNYSATISSLGAELKSLKDTKSEQEYIWQGDANNWQGSAPILFPIVGRLKNGTYQFNNKTYQLNKHGFARTSTFAVEQTQDNAVTFTLTANAETKESYPFDFVFVVTFTLGDLGLSVRYQVHNNNKEAMVFTLGSHPALSLPLTDCKLDDYFIEFSQNETLDCYFLDNDLLTEQPIKHYLDNQNIIPIHQNLFDNDALIFKNIQSNKVYLKNKKTGLRLTMDTGNAPHFGLWAKPNAPFVCFEPWYSFDDTAQATRDFTSKPGMISLKENATFETGYQLILNSK